MKLYVKMDDVLFKNIFEKLFFLLTKKKTMDLSYLPIEQNFICVCTFSLLLVTVALVFFHMAVVKSVEMPKYFAQFFSISLIIISAVYIGLGLVQYHQRIQKFDDLPATEKVYWIIFLTLGILFMFLEIFICMVMIQKSSNRKLPFSNR